MKAPTALVPSEFKYVNQPLQGAEFESYLSVKAHTDIGLFTITGANLGTFVPDTVGMQALTAVPQELLAFVTRPMPDAGVTDIVLTVTGTSTGGTALTGTATIKLPAYSPLLTKTFSRSFAVDVLTVLPGTKWATVTTVSVTCAAGAKYGEIGLMGLPDLVDFTRVGCTGEQEFVPRDYEDIAVRCGKNPSAFVQPGDLAEGSLTIRAKFFNGVNGLSAFRGQQCTAMLVEKRGNVGIITARYFFTQYIPKAPVTAPEGSESVTLQSQSRYQELLQFLALGTLTLPFALLTSFGPLIGDGGPLIGG